MVLFECFTVLITEIREVTITPVADAASHLTGNVHWEQTDSM